MIHPHTELRLVNETIGLGVFATTFIPKGTIVYVIDPLELMVTPQQYAQYPELLKKVVDKYSYIEANRNRIVSWDSAKYVNHCCDGKSMSCGYGFELAIRDIQAGEEITDEYGMFNMDCEMDLHCTSKNCRKKLKRDDLDLYHADWDQKVRSALQLLFKVEQPLLPLVDNDTLQQLQALDLSSEHYRSVLELKCKD